MKNKLLLVVVVFLLSLFAVTWGQDISSDEHSLEAISNPTEYARLNCKYEWIKDKINREWIGKMVYFSFDPEEYDTLKKVNYYKIPRAYPHDRYYQSDLEGHSAIIKNAYRDINRGS